MAILSPIEQGDAMITREHLISVLRYDPVTGDFTWIEAPSVWLHRLVGTVAGRKHLTQIQIRISGKNYLAHRLAWLYVHGVWPKEYIDHINGDPCDNRLSNLREATARENMFNRRMQKSNRLGVKGVLCARAAGRFMSRIRIDGRSVHLGTFDSVELASAAYAAAAVATRGEFVRLN